MIHSHKEVFRIVPEWDEYWIAHEFDSYEEALLYAIDRLDRFRIEKMYVRKS